MPRLAIGVLFVLALLGALGALHMVRPRSESAEPAPEPQGFASERNPAAPSPFAFDGKRTMGYLDDLCRIGPRISGTPGMREQQELLQKHFEKHGGKVELQKFTARQRSQQKPVEMTNLVISWFPERPRRVILCSHYDTRPLADQEEDPRKWREPFTSANDGGSGVALLMEFAHHMKDAKLAVGVDFVLFDGEEYIFDRDADKYFFGSDHFADTYKKDRPKHRYSAAILLDMIGGRNAHFPAEPNSWALAGALVQDVWDVAQTLKCPAFQRVVGRTPVQDDHLALNRVGIPAIDIIDFDYPHWHRLSDVPANCSADTLEQVARVLAVWLQKLK